MTGREVVVVEVGLTGCDEGVELGLAGGDTGDKVEVAVDDVVGSGVGVGVSLDVGVMLYVDSKTEVTVLVIVDTTVVSQGSKSALSRFATW
jgi:hypothetical protein